MSALATTQDLIRRLRRRYKGNGWIMLQEVGNGAGARNTGWSDAIAMQTWPSKDLRLLGFEIKASRSDWLKELDQTQKNEAWQKACHEWYVVAPANIVNLDELPLAWGLLIPKGEDDLRIASRCEKEAAGNNVPLDLLAAVFRAAGKGHLLQRTRNEIRREVTAMLEGRIRNAEDDRAAALAKYDEIVDLLGTSHFETLKARARAVVACDPEHVADQAGGVARQMEILARSLRSIEKELRA